MTPPPLCIIQARYHSTRLPGKMLLPLGGETLIARAWRQASTHFGTAHTVVAIPHSDATGPLAAELNRLSAGWVSIERLDEADVLSRFYFVAHRRRWLPGSVIHRWTPDDPFKASVYIDRVVKGERLPAEWGGEAFTLAMLDEAHARESHPHRREHISYAIFGGLPPSPPAGVWTIDTREDYEAACRIVEQAAA